MRAGRVEVSGGAIFVAALLLYLDKHGVALQVLLVCLAHELGHLGAIRCLGGRVSCLRLTCAGAELQLSAVRRLSPGRMALTALAGPAVNLLLALASASLASRGVGKELYLFAGLNLGAACFNLLPAGWLDGGRALENLLAALGAQRLGRQVTRVCSAAVTLGLLLAGGLLFWESEGRNFTVLLSGLWMVAAGGGAEMRKKAAIE